MPRPLSQTPLYSDSGRWELAEALFTTFGQQIYCSECQDDPQNNIFTRDLAGKDSRDGKQRRQWACRRTNSRRRESEIRCPRQSNQTFISTARQQLGELVFQQVLQDTIAEFTLEELRLTTLGTYLPGKLRGRTLGLAVEVPPSPKRPRLEDNGPTTPRPSIECSSSNPSHVSETPAPTPGSTSSKQTRSTESKQHKTSSSSPSSSVSSVEGRSSIPRASVDSAPREGSVVKPNRSSQTPSRSPLPPRTACLTEHDLRVLVEFKTEWQEQAQVLRSLALRGASQGLLQLGLQVDLAIKSIQQVHQQQVRYREETIQRAFADSSDPRGLEIPPNSSSSSLPSVQAGSRSLSSSTTEKIRSPKAFQYPRDKENIPPDSPPPSPRDEALPSSAGVTILPKDDPELENWQVTSAARALVKRWHSVASAADRKPIRDEAKANPLIGKEFNRQLRLHTTSSKGLKKGRLPLEPRSGSAKPLA